MSKEYENMEIPFEDLELPKTEEELMRYVERSDKEVNNIKNKWNKTWFQILIDKIKDSIRR